MNQPPHPPHAPHPPRPKTITLVGHCGPDSSFLRMAVSSAAPGTLITMADSDRELAQAITSGTDLLMLNRQLEFGFAQGDGVAVLRQIKQQHPAQRVLMVSNYPETQEEALAAGALPGFGKREIGTEKVKQRIREALNG